MWQTILTALLKELQTNPDRVLAIVEQLVALLKANPELVTALVAQLPKGATK